MTISNSNFLFLFRLVYFQQFILANTHSASGNIILIFVIENGISNTSKYQNSVRWIQIKIDETFQKRNRFTIPMKLSFYENVWILYFFFFYRYVLICRSSTFWGKIIPTVGTGLKSVAVIWYMSTMTTAMQLHLRNRMSEETFGNIFVSSTVMFTVLPSAVSVFLATLIFCDRKTYGTRDVDQAETLLLLGESETEVPGYVDYRPRPYILSSTAYFRLNFAKFIPRLPMAKFWWSS